MDYGMFQNPYNPYAQTMPYMAQQTKAPVNNVSWVYVNGYDGAKSQIVQPGQTCWMMDNNDSIIYVKTVDSVGTSVLKGFRLTEITGTATDPNQSAKYVSQSDFDDVLKRLKTLENEFGGLNT